MVYILSIAGVDIHTCSHTGKVYASFLPFNLSCEEIHPQEEHDHCDCCHGGHHDKNCCHDEVFQLLFSGDDNHSGLTLEAPLSLIIAAVRPPVLSVALPCSHAHHERGHCCHRTVPDIIHQLCVMRA